ncbi:MAG: molybdenum cofactor biosynthesis protein MoeB [Proteobacteria bacterium]|nr:molybdenum cofactor biosynthesis protein MoeB [Pseudomonadota bacterium]
MGTIGVVDFDVVDMTNLQRQILYSGADVGRDKVEAAVERLRGINADIDIVAHRLRLDSANVLDLVAEYDIVADGTDNFPTRYLINDACVLKGKANVHASIFRFEGQISVFDARRGPCYRCLFPEPPPPGMVPSCAEGGVLGVLPGIVGSLQALEVIKLVLGIGEPLIGRLSVFDALDFTFREIKIGKDARCVVCGPHPTVTAPIDYEAFCGVASRGRTEDADPVCLSVEEVAALRRGGRSLNLLDVREPHEHDIAAIAGARLIPLGELATRLHELDGAQDLVVFCKRGPRSLKAAALLREAGMSDVRVMAGGIEAWAERIEPTMARY